MPLNSRVVSKDNVGLCARNSFNAAELVSPANTFYFFASGRSFYGVQLSVLKLPSDGYVNPFPLPQGQIFS